MVDVFLPIFAASMAAAAVVGSVRLLAHYQQPDDKRWGSGLLCRAIIVASLTLSWMLVLLLPLDVRSSRSGHGLADAMPALWGVAFALLGTFAVLVVPGAIFYNDVEQDDAVPKKRRYVLCCLSAMLFILASLAGIGYPFLSDIALPVQEYSCDAWLDATVGADAASARACTTSRAVTLEAKAGVEAYLVALLCFAGWLLLSCFGGIGLTAVPLDLVLSFVDRPRAIDEATYSQRRKLLGGAARAMLGQSEELKKLDEALAEEQAGWWGRRARRRLLTKDYNKFKRDMNLLEEEFDRLSIAKFQRGENPVVSAARLALGGLCALVSAAWVLHVALYVLIVPKKGEPASLFLNLLFESCEKPGLYPVGVAMFAAFCLYLLLCVVKGCLKFGMRFFFMFSIHPMRFKGTPLSSILFNVEMVLLSSAAVVQFAQQAFADYARLTDADALLGAQLRHMKFFGWFFKYNVFVYALLAWCGVSLIYLLVRPRDRSEVGLHEATAARLEELACRGLAAPKATAGAGGKAKAAEIATAPTATIFAPPLATIV